MRRKRVAATPAPVAGARIKELSPSNFDTLIRQIKILAAGKVEAILSVIEAAMRRMRLRPDLSKVVGGAPPDGSDQYDLQSFIRWTEKIVKKDAVAKQQLVAFHATCKARLGG